MAAADQAPAPWRRPPVTLLGGVVLAHALLLGLRPPTAAPTMRPAPAAVSVRVVAVAVKPAPTSPPVTPLPAPAAPRTVPPRPARAAPAPRAPAPAARKPLARPAVVWPHAPTRQPPDPGVPTAHDAHATAPPAVDHRADAPSPEQATNAADAPVRLPPSARLDYRVRGTARGLPFEAEAQLLWQRDGDHYQAEWTVRVPLLGQRTQRSEGAVTAVGLAPERYAEQTRGERAAHFDHAGGRIRFSANTPDAALGAGAQDRLSVSLQLGGLLAAAPQRYPPGSTLVLQTAGVREAEAWRWDVQPDETLHIDGQDVPCAKLVRQPRREHDTRVELWLARPFGHLPARLRVSQSNGDVADQQLSALPAR